MPRLVALALPLVVLLGACGDDDPAVEPASRATTTTTSPDSTGDAPRTGSTAAGAETTLNPPSGGLVMRGPTGAGRASVTLVPDRSEVCYEITVRDIGEPSSAHVHRRDGEVVLGLQPPTPDGSIDTCAATDALLIEELALRPSDFYIDVHGTLGDLRATLE